MEVLIVIYYLLGVLDLIMLISAICSWIPAARESKFYMVLEKILYPFLHPIRLLLDKFEWTKKVPIDLSFLTLIIISSVLQNLILLVI